MAASPVLGWTQGEKAKIISKQSFIQFAIIMQIAAATWPGVITSPARMKSITSRQFHSNKEAHFISGRCQCTYFLLKCNIGSNCCHWSIVRRSFHSSAHMLLLPLQKIPGNLGHEKQNIIIWNTEGSATSRHLKINPYKVILWALWGVFKPAGMRWFSPSILPPVCSHSSIIIGTRTTQTVRWDCLRSCLRFHSSPLTPAPVQPLTYGGTDVWCGHVDGNYKLNK